MLRLVTGGYKVSSNAPRNRNFFQINPIFPKAGEHEYKLYGKQRNRITALEYTARRVRRSVQKDYMLYEVLYKRPERNRLDKHFSRNLLLDAETHLPYGLGFDSYINMYKTTRASRAQENATSEQIAEDRRYVDAISKIIHKLKLRSEPELVRYFRLALAKSDSKEIDDQITGTLLKKMVLKAAEDKNKQKITTLGRRLHNRTRKIDRLPILLNNQQDRLFASNLEELDRRIIEAEEQLGIHERHSLRQELYHPEFNPPKTVQKVPVDLEADSNFDHRPIRMKGIKAGQSKQEYLDEVYRNKISRLYFLKKLESQNTINAPAKEFADEEQVRQINTQLMNLGLTDFNKHVQTLSHKYRLENTIPKGKSDSIIRDVELFVSSLQVGLKSLKDIQPPSNDTLREFLEISKQENQFQEEKVVVPTEPQVQEYKREVENTGKRDKEFVYSTQIVKAREMEITKTYKTNLTEAQKKNKIQEKKDQKNRIPNNPKNMLWANLTVEEVFDPQLLLKSVPIKEEEKFDTTVDRSKKSEIQSQIEVSPNRDVQVSLHGLPFNIYKHTEFEIFGQIAPGLTEQNLQLNELTQRVMDERKEFPTFHFEEEAKRKKRPPIPPQSDKQEFYGAGRRKTAKAMVRIRPGIGIVKVNRKNMRDYLADSTLRGEALKPLVLSCTAGQLDVDFFVAGGGSMAQLDAMNLALVKALLKREPELKFLFRRAGLVTQDTRLKERKHSGFYKARKAYPYVRR